MPLDYETPRPVVTSAAPFWWTFIATWVVGVIAGGLAADATGWVWRGRPSDGGMYFVCAMAIVIEFPLLMVLRHIFGPQKPGVLFAAAFGVLSGPTVMIIVFAVVMLETS